MLSVFESLSITSQVQEIPSQVQESQRRNCEIFLTDAMKWKHQNIQFRVIEVKLVSVAYQ